MDQFCFVEERIAEGLGLTRDHVRQYRDLGLVIDVDWRYVRNQVAYTKDGAAKLLKLAGVNIPAKRPRRPGGLTLDILLEQARIEPATTAAVRWEPQEQDLRISQLTANQSIVLARPASYPRDVPGALRVRVRPCEHWRVGMRLRACHHVQRDYWEYLGVTPRGRRDVRLLDKEDI